ncbi:hypothetical protein DPMN_157671 [Dreissena polymorpha]|uniref:Uncharacterized protein n=1 Tax=Dreissena polymorpha TaxID=45954 RepID=A0A9D4EIB7_DREPO|nr:hypothetical protein DPMN_157671 [Dreissena polymorpha]
MKKWLMVILAVCQSSHPTPSIVKAIFRGRIGSRRERVKVLTHKARKIRTLTEKAMELFKEKVIDFEKRLAIIETNVLSYLSYDIASDNVGQP